MAVTQTGHRKVGGHVTRVEWSGETLTGRRFVGARYVDIDMLELTTERVVFEECDFSGVKLNASVHRATAFLRCRFRRTSLFAATFAECKLTGSEFLDSVLRPLQVDGGDWSYVRMRGADLSGVSLRGVRLAEADLTNAVAKSCDLRDCDLSRARIHHTDFSGADLRGARLDGVDVLAATWTHTKVDLAQSARFAAAHGAIVE